MNAKAAKELVDQFETGRLPSEQWTHEAHFIMALWYCSHQPLPAAIQSIREGIKKYNLSVGGVNTDDAGYHETITVFYTQLIILYIFNGGRSLSFESRLAGLYEQPFLQKDFPLKYYSKELLMSKEARKTWTPPNLQPFVIL